MSDGGAVIPLKAAPPPDAEPPDLCRELGIRWAEELQPSLEGNDFVEDLLQDGALSCVYGPPGSGKTLLAVDLALHVACGWPWAGRGIEQRQVLYIAGEGLRGLRDRLAIMRKKQFLVGEELPLAVIDGGALNLRAEESADYVRDCIQAIQKAYGAREILVIVDTLMATFGGGNDNDAADMGAFCGQMRRIISATDAHIMVIHHSGKDVSLGARGSTVLRAAVDTEIAVTSDGTIVTAEVKKQRDLPTAGRLAFEIERVPMGVNKWGNPRSSVVIKPVADAGRASKAPQPLTALQKSFLEIVQDLFARAGTKMRPEPGMREVTAVTRESVRTFLKQRGFFPEESTAKQISTNTNAYLNALRGKGFLGVNETHVWSLKG